MARKRIILAGGAGTRLHLLVNEKGIPGETYNVGGHNERTNLESGQRLGPGK